MTQSPRETSFPKSKIKVLLLEGVHPSARDRMEQEGFQVEYQKASPSTGEIKSMLADAHILGIRSKTQITADLIASAPLLLGIGCFCIGTNQVDLTAAASVGVPVFNSPFSNTRSVAELTIAEIVALHRRLFELSSQLHAGTWNKTAAQAHEVRGRTLGIVGYGHIGTQVSVLAEAMGMRVVYYDIVPKLPLGNARAVGSLDELLETADVVTLHTPATPDTEGLISAAELAKMRPGALLINNARGSIVDIDALASAMREKRVGGAALDVFPSEPAASGDRFASELQGMPNVILSPHIGGSTQEAQENIALDVSTKLTRFMNIGSTTGAVNVPEVELPGQGARELDEGFRPHRLLHFHKNVPGVLGRINGIAAELGVNITAQYLQTLGELGYVVLDVAPSDAAGLEAALRDIPESIRVRVLW